MAGTKTFNFHGCQGGWAPLPAAQPDKLLFQFDDIDATIPVSGLAIERNGHTALSILTPNNMTGYLIFGDPDDNDVGGLYYDHSANLLAFMTNAGNAAYLDSSHVLHIDVDGDGTARATIFDGHDDASLVEAVWKGWTDRVPKDVLARLIAVKGGRRYLQVQPYLGLLSGAAYQMAARLRHLEAREAQREARRLSARIGRTWRRIRGAFTGRPALAA